MGIVINKGPATPPAEREILRCNRCKLLQYRTINGKCRKCLIDYSYSLEPKPLPPPPPRPKKRFNGPDPDKCPKSDSLGGLPMGFVIRGLRTDNDITQDALAKAIRQGHSYISRVESGHITPGVRKVYQLCNALHISAQSFIQAVENQWEPDDIKQIMKYAGQLPGADIRQITQWVKNAIDKELV